MARLFHWRPDGGRWRDGRWNGFRWRERWHPGDWVEPPPEFPVPPPPLFPVPPPVFETGESELGATDDDARTPRSSGRWVRHRGKIILHGV
jgi:hypothetical protein